MDYISSKNISLLVSETLKLIDNRIVNHGSKVAYLIYKMLECKGGYEKFEVAELALLATIHDIGAYKTDADNDMLTFEFKNFAPHSIYGYLFVKHLSPFEDKAKILLYHNTDWSQIENMDFEYKDIAAYINIAEKVIIYNNALGDKFEYTMFEKYRNSKFSPEALDLLYQAIKGSDALKKINTEEYIQELEGLYSFILFTNEEKEKYLEMMLFCAGLRSENSVVDTVTSICICEELGRRLGVSNTELEILYYGALLHDMGMLAVPKEIIEANRKLTVEEIAVVRSHVNIEIEILKDKLTKEVFEVAISHHERSDGSGYPRGLKDNEMNRLQKIMQLADTVCGLTNKRSYHNSKTKDEVIAIITDEVGRHKYSKEVADTFIYYYDGIMQRVAERANEILFTHDKLNDQYEAVLKNFMK